MVVSRKADRVCGREQQPRTVLFRFGCCGPCLHNPLCFTTRTCATAFTQIWKWLACFRSGPFHVYTHGSFELCTARARGLGVIRSTRENGIDLIGLEFEGPTLVHDLHSQGTLNTEHRTPFPHSGR